MASSTDSIASTTTCGCSSWTLCRLFGTTSRVPFVDSSTSDCCPSCQTRSKRSMILGGRSLNGPATPRRAQQDQWRIVEQRPGRIEHRPRLRCRPSQVEVLPVQAGVVLERPELLLPPDAHRLRFAIATRRQRSAEPGTHPRSTWVDQHDAGDIPRVRGCEHAQGPHGHRVAHQDERPLDPSQVEHRLEVGHEILARAYGLLRRTTPTEPRPVVGAGTARRREGVDHRVPDVARESPTAWNNTVGRPGSTGPKQVTCIRRPPRSTSMIRSVDSSDSVVSGDAFDGREADWPEEVVDEESSEHPPSVRTAANVRTRAPAYRMRATVDPHSSAVYCHFSAGVSQTNRRGVVEPRSALGYYLDHDRIHTGDCRHLPQRRPRRLAQRADAGRECLMLAPTRDLVARLNQTHAQPGWPADDADTRGHARRRQPGQRR